MTSNHFPEFPRIYFRETDIPDAELMGQCTFRDTRYATYASVEAGKQKAKDKIRQLITGWIEEANGTSATL